MSMEPGAGGSKFNKIVGRAITDEDYRNRLKDPATRQQAADEMLAGSGRSASDLRAELDAAIEAVDRLAEKFGEDPRVAS